MLSNFKISYETTSYVIVGNSIKLNAYHKEGKENLIWKSLDETIVVVDEGIVKAIGIGSTYVRVSYNEEYVDFLVTVISENLSDELAFILKNHESNVFSRLNLGIGAGHTAYYYDVIGSVNKLLFNDPLIYNTSFCKKANERYGEELKNRVMESIEFITVHYTGNMRDGANAYANSCWFVKPLEENPTSIHYVTGNDGVFSSLDEKYIGAHAGDTSSVKEFGKFKWIKTNVKFNESDPKFTTVTVNEFGRFSINGSDTGVSVPLETRNNRGIVTDNKWLNNMGLPVKVVDGIYYIANSWWCYTQVREGRICQNGGNHNSIGIESCVNEGSDLWYTWQKTAQLVADIMIRNKLDITRVRGHHNFSAKNCPQPMLENNLELWWKFIDLVEAEYEKMTKFSELNIKFTPLDEDINNVGRALTYHNSSKLLEYEVEFNGQTIRLGSII